ncbi:protoheme IX farnesyltransferase [Cryomorphaceae bacterium]|nr:protoheme IX farnesyltransferase [Cryomorphaceae bacterium]
MKEAQEITATQTSSFKDYVALAKPRLATSVVFSAGAGYLIGMPAFDGFMFTLLLLGGFLVVGSSNAFNQVIERNQDALMDRTKDRPVPAGRLSVLQALIAATVMGLVGLGLLYWINPLSAMFGALSLFIYTAVYTPLKGVTPLAVFIGAIPGAIPFMLGWVAANNDFDIEPGMLFAMQFFWQFPHFWAIAWILDDDYKKAGYVLLPSGKRDNSSAIQAVFYTVWTVIASLIPATGLTGSLILSTPGAVAVALAGGLFLWQSWNLFRGQSVVEAKKLMFASIIYMPVVQIIYVLDAIW